MGKTGTGAGTGANPTPQPQEQPQTVSFAEYQALQARVQSQDTQIAAMREDTRNRNAAAFAEKHIRGGRMVPAMKDYLIGLYSQADKDDAAQGGTVSLSVTTKDGTEQRTGTRVQSLEAAFDALPASVLTREMLETEGVLPTQRADMAAHEQETADAIKEAKERAQQRAEMSRNGR